MVKYIDAEGNLRYRGTWGLPGGKVEIGDSLDDSLIKEVLEETGLKVIPGEPIGLEEFTTPFAGQKQIMSVIRRAKLHSGKLLSEHQDAHSLVSPAWIPLTGLSKIELAYNEAAEITRLAKGQQVMQ